MVTKFVIIVVLLVVAGEAGKIPDHVTNYIDYNHRFPFKSINKRVELTKCDYSSPYKVDFPVIEDCEIYNELASYEPKDESEYYVLSYHPDEKPVTVHQCIGVSVKYGVTYRITGDNSVDTYSTDYFAVDSEKCRNAPIPGNSILPQPSAGFFSADRHTHTYIRKTKMVSTYKAYAKTIFMPSDGSNIDYSKGGYQSGLETYVWDVLDHPSNEILFSVKCHAVETKVPGSAIYCPEKNSLYTVLKNSPEIKHKGISFRQSVTGEFISGKFQIASDSRSEVFDPHSDVASEVEGSGLLINKVNDAAMRSGLYSKCMARNQIITHSDSKIRLRTFETKLVFNHDETISRLFPEEGYAYLYSCSRVEISEYSTTESFVILKDVKGKVYHYNPMFLEATKDPIGKEYKIGSVIAFLDGNRLNVKTGDVSTTHAESVNLFNYGTLVPYDTHEPMWHPDNYVPDERPKSVFHIGLDAVFAFVGSVGITLILFSILGFILFGCLMTQRYRVLKRYANVPTIYRS